MLNLQLGGCGSYLVWPLSFDLSGLGGIALRVIETGKPTHQLQGNDREGIHGKAKTLYLFIGVIKINHYLGERNSKSIHSD